MTSSELARKSFESFNGITDDAGKEDLIFKYDASQQQEILKAKSWSSNPNYFRKVHISAVALLKMTIHAKSGGDIEVMGLMLGKIVGETMVVMDAFRLPVEGTETRVNAQADGYEYMVEFMKLAKESGRMENAIGWYHSHPGYGCWLSGIDVATQMLHQKYQEPFLAVVIDPKRTISAGKVEIGAFRTYPEGWKDANINSSTSSFQSVPMEKIEDFGVHCNQYYSLEISYFKSSSDAQILQMLWNKYWINSLASSPFISNRDFMNKKISDLCHKLESCRSDGQGRLNAAIANDLKSAGNDKKKQQGSLITSGLEKVREGQMHPSSKPGFGCLYRESERKHKLAKSGGIHRCARDSANLSIETIYNTLQHLALLSSMLNDISEEKRVQVKGLKVRLATVDDIPELVKLINLAYKDAHWFKQPCFYDRVSSESLKQYMNQTTIPAPTTTTTTSIDGGVSASAGTIGNHFFVLEIGNSLIACTYLRAPAIHSQILVSSLSLLSIHPEFQRKGLAKLLFDICCKTVAALFQGNSNLLMQVEVVSLQTHLLDIYGKWGFKQVSTITWKDLGIDEKVNIKIPCHLVVMQMPIS